MLWGGLYGLIFYAYVEESDVYHLKTYADLTPFDLGLYELWHEGTKRLWDLTNEEPDHLNIGHGNVRYYDTWDFAHKGTDVMYNVIYYEDTYIIIPPLWEERGTLYYWGYIYLCKEIDKDVDMFSIGILDPEAMEKLLEFPGEQISRKDIVEKLGKSY